MPFPEDPSDFYDGATARPRDDLDGNGLNESQLLADIGAVLNDLDDTIESGATTVLAEHTGDTIAAHAGTAISFTPTGGISATTVSAAIAELDSEKSATSHGHTLDSLSDVEAPSPSDGQVLKYVGANSRWEPGTDQVGGGGGGATVMGDLTDVVDAGVATGMGLVYNGGTSTWDATSIATQAELDAHTGDSSAAHAASAVSFTPYDTIAATDVQGAIQELLDEATSGGLDTEAVQDAVAAQIVAGNLLSKTYDDGTGSLTLDVDTLTHSNISDWDSEVKEVVAGAGIDLDVVGDQVTVSQLPNDIQEFTASGTWTKPADANALNAWVEVICVGAGGGGGSGRVGTSSTIRGGGGGGASGNVAVAIFRASECASTETVTVGTGGAGGTAQTADSTNGNAGSAGGTSSFGALLAASGGGGGGAGIAGAAAGGTPGDRGTFVGNAGGTGAGTSPGGSLAAQGTLASFANGWASGGGGGGSASDASGGFQTGASGGGGPAMRTAAQAGGTPGGIGSAGNPGTQAGPYGGSGGGAGGRGTTTNSGAGGAGARGAGGGGSGGATNGFDSAVGGAGGGGFVRVITHL
jgi:hypothetical protein